MDLDAEHKTGGASATGGRAAHGASDAPQADDALRLRAFLPYRLSVLSNRVSRMIARDYAERFDLSVPQWRVVAILAEHGELTATGVAEAGQMDKVAVSRATKTLIDRALVRRQPSQDDGRMAVLALTKPGEALFAQIAPLALEREAQLLAALSDDQQAVLDAALATLDARMGELEAAGD